MATRKFFKTDRSRSTVNNNSLSQNIIDDFETEEINNPQSSNIKRKLNSDEIIFHQNFDNNNNIDDDNSSISSGFYSPSGSVIDNFDSDYVSLIINFDLFNSTLISLV